MEKRNYSVLIRIHQGLILLLFTFSLFVKADVKKFFWMTMGILVISLLIQVILYSIRPGAFADKMEEQPGEV